MKHNNNYDEWLEIVFNSKPKNKIPISWLITCAIIWLIGLITGITINI